MGSEWTRRGVLGVAGGAMAVGAGVQAADAPPGKGAPGEIKILGIVTSPRKDKSTAAGVRACLEAAAAVAGNVKIELIELAGLSIPGEPAVGLPLPPGVKDDFPPLVARLTDPAVGGIILGTPVYFGNMSYLCKAFLDRGTVFRRGTFALAGKVAGVLAVGGARNGGQELTVQSVQATLLSQQLIVVGTSPPTARIGATLWSGAPGGVAKDAFGLSTAKDLGQNVARTAIAIRAGKA